jgi:hypothetical protein
MKRRSSLSREDFTFDKDRNVYVCPHRRVPRVNRRDLREVVVAESCPNTISRTLTMMSAIATSRMNWLCSGRLMNG